jgi:two-component system cell cycle sensor histidine kinase/response regulator CckA
LISQTGTIEVDLVNTLLEPSSAHPEIKSGEYLQLMVKDTGSGMTPKVMDHIFEPFFTTKEEGKGVGLGLAIAFGIVQQHGGNILAVSTPQKGTTFTVVLPEEAHVLRREAEEAPASRPS